MLHPHSFLASCISINLLYLKRSPRHTLIACDVGLTGIPKDAVEMAKLQSTSITAEAKLARGNLAFARPTRNVSTAAYCRRDSTSQEGRPSGFT